MNALIAEKDIDAVFSDAAVAKLLHRVSADAAIIGRAGRSIREAVHVYLALRARTAWKDIRRQIERLYGLAERAARSSEPAITELAERIAGIDPAVRQSVERSIYRRVAFPTADEIRNEGTRQAAISRLQSILSTGLKWAKGRKRPNGQRSRSLKPLLRVPDLGRGRPRDIAARELMQNLRLIWLETSGQRPPNWVSADNSTLQPFFVFVSEVFGRLGIKNYEELVNEREIARRIMERSEIDGTPDEPPASMEETRQAFEEHYQWRHPRCEAAKDKRKKKAARAKVVRHR